MHYRMQDVQVLRDVPHGRDMPVDWVVDATFDARLIRTFQCLEQRTTAQRIDHRHYGQTDGGQRKELD